MSLIEINNVTKIYDGTAVPVKALNEVNLTINVGEFTAIVGPSGSGKTTLLNIIGGLDIPTSGNIIVDNVDISTYKPDELINFRLHHIGFVFQAYNLVPVFTAKENIMLPALISGMSKSSAEKKALELLDYLNVIDRKEHKPQQMSGGEQQRVAIARALAKNPEILLCDEPTGALDSASSREVLKILRKFSTEFKKTVIIITHEASIANMADRVMYIRDGKIEKIVKNENPIGADEVVL